MLNNALCIPCLYEVLWCLTHVTEYTKMCIRDSPYFDTVAAYNSFYPASEDLIKELGIDGFRACDYSTMWCAAADSHCT